VCRRMFSHETQHVAAARRPSRHASRIASNLPSEQTFVVAGRQGCARRLRAQDRPIILDVRVPIERGDASPQARRDTLPRSLFKP
jgi:hypothetical protein